MSKQLTVAEALKILTLMPPNYKLSCSWRATSA